MRAPFGRRIAVALAAAAAIVRPATSAADATPSLGLVPAPAGDPGVIVERTLVRGHLQPAARVLVDGAHEPMVVANAAQALDRAVASQVWTHVLAALPLWHRVVVHADLPFVVREVAGAPPPSGTVAPAASPGAALGDVRLGARAVVLASPSDARVRAAIGLGASVSAPTSPHGWSGEDAARARAVILGEIAAPRLYLALEGGVHTRPWGDLPSARPTRWGTAARLGVAGGFFADEGRTIALGTELVAEATVARGVRLLDAHATVAHWLVTAHWRVVGGPIELGAALGPGLGAGPGSADVRAVGLVGWAPESKPPPPDRDRDGIPDAKDACVDLAGEPSRDPLLHGCPEPPPDHDADGVPDENDACPKVAGAPTGDRATHGCPRPVDTDGDGVLDPDDACPTEPGAADYFGCPKPAPSGPTRLVGDRIEIAQRVEFETGTAVLRPDADAVLTDVARVLAAHPEVAHLEVQGHTDETGSADRNRALGAERAGVVVDRLVALGVDRARLSARGYGADRPIADNVTDEGRQRNRRVEFRVLAAPPGGEGAP